MHKENLSFGQRLGFVSADDNIQIDYCDKHLRIDLYNTFLIYVYSALENAAPYEKALVMDSFKIIWINYLRKPLDEFPGIRQGQFRDRVKSIFLSGAFYEPYEFFEFIISKMSHNYIDIDDLLEYLNEVLERNNSGYRLINKKFVPITNQEEISEIKKAAENAINNNIIGLSEHLETAISLLAKKPEPDFRNSIKESISMVEAVSRTIEPEQHTLGSAFKKLEDNKRLNPTLKSAFEKLYAYSNGRGGIRHALMEEENIEMEDARFFLISCSAFSNYLIEKARKDNLL